jgi:hypothetical protein
MKALGDGKVVQGIIKAHRTPKRPHPEEIETAVRRAYGLAPTQILDGSHRSLIGLPSIDCAG